MEQRKRQRVQERVCWSREIVVNALVCRSLDISEGGIYVLTDHVFAVGTVVTVEFDTGKDKISVKARVKHIVEGLGFGLMFIDLDDMVKKKIKEFVQETKNKESSAR